MIIQSGRGAEKEPTSDKRIVSKGEYVAIKGLGLSLRASSRGFMALAFCCWCIAVWMFSFFACTVVVFFMLLCCGRSAGSTSLTALYILIVFAVSSAVAVGLTHLCKASKSRADQIENVVVFNHANTANLPAPESLVRASSEPIQAQEAVLLRAAVEVQETPVEQLVRAVGAMPE